MHKVGNYAIFVFVPGKGWACWASGIPTPEEAVKEAERVIPEHHPGFTAVDIVWVAKVGGPQLAPINWRTD